MDTPTPPTATADHPPDWSTLSDHVPCPLCDYNLRGLVDPRCPECGFSFTWPVLLETRRTVHPYLFEHHPERNLRSLLRTLVAGILPRRFWHTLTPAHAVRPRRLVLYWILVVALVSLTVILPLANLARAYYLSAANTRAAQIVLIDNPANAWVKPYYIRQYGSTQAFLDTNFPAPDVLTSLARAWPESRKDVFFWACFVAWPLVTTAVLLIYRRSTRQASIRPAQILRCAIYSADAGVLLVVFIAASLAYTMWVLQTRVNYLPFLYGLFHLLYRFPALLWIGLLPLLTYRLTIAYAHYLRFRTAWLAVPLAQVVVLLIYCQLYVWLVGFPPR